jgi:hypothetical protein
MLNRVAFIAVVVALAAFASARSIPPTSDIGFTSNGNTVTTSVEKDDGPVTAPGLAEGMGQAWRDDKKLVGASTFLVAHTVHKTGDALKATGEAMGNFTGSSKDTARNAGHAIKDAAVKTKGGIVNGTKAVGHGIADAGKWVVDTVAGTGKLLFGTVVLTGEGLVHITKEGGKKIGNFVSETGQSARYYFVVVPKNAAHSVKEGAVRIVDNTKSYFHDLKCNMDDAWALEFDPASNESFCVDKDYKRLEGKPVKRTDEEKKEEREIDAYAIAPTA